MHIVSKKCCFKVPILTLSSLLFRNVLKVLYDLYPQYYLTTFLHMCLHVLPNLYVKFCRHSHNYRMWSELAKIWWLGKNMPTLHPGQTYIIHIRCSSSIENPNDCINFLLVKTKVMCRRCKNPGCKQRKFQRFFCPTPFMAFALNFRPNVCGVVCR